MTEAEVVENICELVLAKLKVIGKLDFFLGLFYRHTNKDPSSMITLCDKVANILHKMHLPNVILAVDFNLPDIDWENMQVRSSLQYGTSTEVNQIAVDTAEEKCVR